MSEERKIIYCDECKHEFYLDSVKINEAEVDCLGEQLTLMYFTCPKCNKIYNIGLKDAQFEMLKEDLDKTKKRIRKNHGSGNLEFARTLNNMVQRKHERLMKHMKKLNSKYPGTFTFTASENNDKGQQTIVYHG